MKISSPAVYYHFYNRSSLNDKSSSKDSSLAARQEHALGRRLLLHGLKDACGICLTPDELEKKLLKAENGKPFLPEGFPQFSISHCPGMASCALCETPVGMDVEQIRPFRENILRKVLTPQEKEAFSRFTKSFPEKQQELFFRYWTLKESFIKYTGEGLSRPLTDISFSLPYDMMQVPSDHPDLLFFQQKIGEEHILSVCIKKAGSSAGSRNTRSCHHVSIDPFPDTVAGADFSADLAAPVLILV